MAFQLESKHASIWTKLHVKIWGNQFKRNMLWGSGLSAVSTLATGLSYTVYLNFLGYEQYGVWLTLSMVVSFYQIGNLGVSQGLAKKIAEYSVQKEHQEIRSYISTGTLMMCVVGAILVLLVCICQNQVISLLHISGGNKSLVLHLLPLTATFSAYIFVVDIANNALVGLGRLDLCSFCQVLLQALTLLLATIALYAGYGVTGMLIGNCLACLAVHIISLWLTGKAIHKFPLSLTSFSWTKARSLLNFGGWLFGSTLLGLLMSPVNRAALVRYGSLSAVPLYDIPFNSCLRLKSFIDASQRALIAEVSSLSVTKRAADEFRIGRLINQSLRLILMSSLLFVLVGIFITPALKIWLRSRYVPEMSGSFRIMLVGAFFSLLGIPGYYVLLGLGNSFQIFLSNFMQTFVNFLLLSYFIKQPSGVTAPHLLIAATIGYAASSAWLLIALWVKLKSRRTATSAIPI